MLLRSVFSDFPARRMRAPARCMIPPRRGWRTAPIPPSGLRRDPRTFQQSAGLLEPAGTLTGRTCCSHPRWRTGCSFPEDWTKEKRPAFQQGVCVVRPTGFEPAFSPAGSVGLERSPQGTKTLQSGRYQAVKEETQFPCGFRVHPTKLAPICKNRGGPWHSWAPTVFPVLGK